MGGGTFGGAWPLPASSSGGCCDAYDKSEEGCIDIATTSCCSMYCTGAVVLAEHRDTMVHPHKSNVLARRAHCGNLRSWSTNPQRNSSSPPDR